MAGKTNQSKPDAVAVAEPPAPAPEPKTETEAAKSALVQMIRKPERQSQLASLLALDLQTERGRLMLDRFVTVALHTATSDPDLLRATTESLVESIRDAAMYGLEPVGFSGDGAIVVYDEKRVVTRPGRRPGTTVEVEIRVPTAQFQPMYRGLLKLARRSDEIAAIDAQVVYEGDEIALETGSSPFVRHIPTLDGSKRGGYRGAYAYARLRNGELHVDYMTSAEIEVSRKQSRARNSLGWSTFWQEMARKTVLRRLMKRLPLESLAETALRRESEAEERAAIPVVVEHAPPSEARARIAARFAGGGAAGSIAATSASGGAANPVATAPDSARPDAQAAETTDYASADSGGSETVLDRESAESTSEDAGAGDQDAAETATDDDADEAEAREICGAESDPKLGPVETCVLAPDHDLAADGSKVHKAETGTVWPVAKRTKGESKE